MTGRRQLTPSAWSVVQAGLHELLLSPVVKRRAGIELRCTGVDADVVASGEMVDGRRREMFGGGCARDIACRVVPAVRAEPPATANGACGHRLRSRGRVFHVSDINAKV